MTTPEKLRARQYREGLILILLGIFTVAQLIYFQKQDKDQGRCIATKVDEIVTVLQARSNLTTEESQATQDVILATDQIHSSREFHKLLMRYSASIDRINSEREANPVPDYPSGDCNARRTPAAALISFITS